MQRRWWVMIAVSLFFAFQTAATFSSFGIVLYAMAADFGWSNAAAGMSFSLLGLACGLASTVPVWLMARVGTRLTMVSGAAMMVAGALLACFAQGLVPFYIAAMLLGMGFTLGGNVPCMYLLASWFPERSARMIGIYLMVGALGGMLAPPLVQAVLELADWQTHWILIAVAGSLVGSFGLLTIRDAPEASVPAGASATGEAASEPGWSAPAAQRTPHFVLVVSAYVLMTLGATTMHSSAMPHLVNLDVTRMAAAVLLSLVALASAFAKGAGAWVCEAIGAQRLLIGTLLCSAGGLMALSVASSQPVGYLFAVLFGLGWGGTYLATHVLLIEWFGRRPSAKLLALMHLWNTVATVGPLAAGMMADALGSFAGIFWIYAGLALALAAVLLWLGAPGEGDVAATPPLVPPIDEPELKEAL